MTPLPALVAIVLQFISCVCLQRMRMIDDMTEVFGVVIVEDEADVITISSTLSTSPPPAEVAPHHHQQDLIFSYFLRLQVQKEPRNGLTINSTR